MNGTSENQPAGASSAPSGPLPTAPASTAHAALERAAASSSAAPGEGASALPPGSSPVSPDLAPRAPAGDPKRHPIPLEDHERILNHTRRELEGRLEKLAWAERLRPDAVQQAMELAERFQGNPAAFAQEVLRRFGQGPSATEEALTDPDPDILSERDPSVRAYSDRAVQQLLANQAKRLSQTFSKELQPALEFVSESRERQRLEALKSEAHQTASELMATARTFPHFKDQEPAILEELNKVTPEIRQRIGSPAALLLSYIKVLTERVLPTLPAKTEEAMVAGLKQAAQASLGSIHPQQGPSPKPAIKDGDLGALANRLRELSRVP